MDIKILLNAIPFELERAIAKNINTRLKRRPSSAPFLSGDTFRAFADVLYDETKKCTAEDIKEGSIVFVNNRMLHSFIKDIFPNITQKFILLTHQDDINITNTQEFIAIADTNNVIHWFAQNCTLEHKKVTPLPIGLEDTWLHNAGYVKDFTLLVKNKKSKKNPKIVVAFTMGTNADARFECYRALWRKPITNEFPGSLTCRQYRNLLKQAMFVASPEGNGLDCHRTWESIYLGVVPIVKRNYMTEYFASLSLPIWIIDSWDEIANCSEEELTKKYNDIMLKSKTEAAYFDYWKKLVRDKLKGY